MDNFLSLFRKRCASPHKFTPLSVALPFSFIDYYRKFCNKDVSLYIFNYYYRNLNKDYIYNINSIMIDIILLERNNIISIIDFN